MVSGFDSDPVGAEAEPELGNWPLAFFIVAALAFLGGGVLVIVTELL